MYSCMYCKNHLTFKKSEIIRHLKKGCRKMKNRCSHLLFVKVRPLSCHVYMTEKNCHLDVIKDILPHVRLTKTVKYLTTSNNWKTVHEMNSSWSSSEEEDKDEKN